MDFIHNSKVGAFLKFFTNQENVLMYLLIADYKTTDQTSTVCQGLLTLEDVVMNNNGWGHMELILVKSV